MDIAAPIALGLLLLLVGGDALVRGSVTLARRLGVSPFIIGAVLVGFGTSTPELVTSLDAAFRGSTGIAIGNVVGSNIANVLLIIGAAAIAAPILAHPTALRRDLIALGAATVVAVAALQFPTIGRGAGLVFITGLVAYVAVSITLDMRRRSSDEAARLHAEEAEAPGDWPRGLALAATVAVAGLAAVVFGADLLVNGGVALARVAGLSETAIGLSIVAVGTSLPELAASVSAALKRHGDVALGNVVGSNIYNIFGILGVTATVHPMPTPDAIAHFDVWIMAAATLALIVVVHWRRGFDRLTGAAFLLAYAAYVAWLLVGGSA